MGANLKKILKRIGTPIGVCAFLLVGLARGCSLEVTPVSQCKSQAESAVDPVSIRKYFEKPSATGSTFAPELIDAGIKTIISDPDTQKMEFASCMVDADALCFLTGDSFPISDQDMKALFVERGWAQPTKWDCFWPKTKTVVENPFD